MHSVLEWLAVVLGMKVLFCLHISCYEILILLALKGFGDAFSLHFLPCEQLFSQSISV